MRFGGTLGVRRDNASRSYARARYPRKDLGRWLTQDPIGFDGGDWNLYRYCGGNPATSIDPSGLQEGGYFPIPGVEPPKPTPSECCLGIFVNWWLRWQHNCNPLYTHCMACCTISRYSWPDAARGCQHWQNKCLGASDKKVDGETVLHRRWRACNAGIAVPTSSSCHAGCIKAFPWPVQSPHCKGHEADMKLGKGALPPVQSCRWVT